MGAVSRAGGPKLQAMKRHSPPLLQPADVNVDVAALPPNRHAPTSSVAGRRLAELDWLRVIAFGLLILYHVGMFYVSWDWHVKSPRLIEGLESWMVWLNPWRMSLLFLIGGAALGLMAERGQAGLLGLRSKRLLLPLIFGMSVIVPPQAYLEVVEKLHYSGSYRDFLTLYFQAYHGFCRDGHCLSLPTWNHLWFLPYLWLYSMVALLALKASRWSTHPAWARLASGTRLLWVPWLLFAWLRQHWMAQHPITHDLVNDVYNHALSFSMFVLGMALFGHRDDRHGAWAAARRWRWLALGLAVAVQVGFTQWASVYGDAEIPPADLMALRALSAARQWLPIVAALGWARQLLSHRDGPALRWLSTAVFPFYIVHQTVTVISAHALAPLRWPLVVEVLAVIALTALGCLLAAWLTMRVNWLRPWMGVAPRQAGGKSKAPSTGAQASATT